MLACSTTPASLPKKSWVAVGQNFFIQMMLNGQLERGDPVSQPEPRTESRFAPSTLPIAPIDGA